MSGCPPELALERYHLGEIAGTASAAWIPHIEGCPRCREALAALARDDARPRDVPTPIRVVAREGAHGARRRGPLWAWAAPALVAAAAALAVVVWREPAVESFQLKGSGVLALTVDGGGAWTGQQLRPGARVQLSWSGARPGFLAVVAVERDGRASVLFPEAGEVAVAVGGGSPVALGGSLVVEARHQGTRLCAVFEDGPFAVDAARGDGCRAGRAAAVVELEVAE